jgi:ribosomal protein S26
MGEWEKREAGKLGSWEVKRCLWHCVSFLVLSVLRKIRSEEEKKLRLRLRLRE